MFKKILIANRGEIACRIIHTARKMGIATVAVYSDADRFAPHVRLADRAARLGPAPAAESYLNVAAVIAAARETGAEVLVMAPSVGAEKEVTDYIQLFNYDVNLVATALKGTGG